MELVGNLDIYSTKGLEYLITITYLVLLVGFWRYLMRERPVGSAARLAARLQDRVAGWFDVPHGLFFHGGHTWVGRKRANVVRVGMDDFANKLVGTADELDLPAVGDQLTSGQAGWALRLHGRSIDVRSPVSGKVVAVNDAVARAPHLAVDDPYGDGWLLEVRVPRRRSVLRRLLSGADARAWMEQTADRLRERLGGELGVVLQDGGVPVPGMARRLDHDRWHEIVADFLGTRSS